MKQELINFGNKALDKTKEHLPEILLGLGIVTGVAAVGMGVKAGKNAPDVIKKIKEKIQYVHDQNLEGKARAKALIKVYSWAVKELTLVFGPAIALEAASILCFGCSYKTCKTKIKELTVENAKLGATVVALTESAKKIHDNIVERFDEETAYEIEHGAKKEKIEVEEDGKKVKKEVTVADPSKSGCYTKYFTKSNDYWDEISDDRHRPNDDYIQDFFGMRLTELQSRLELKRNNYKDPYITLNDAFEAYGFEREEYGYNPRWKYDRENGHTSIDINWRKCYLKNEDDQFEEAWAVDFFPTVHV